MLRHLFDSVTFKVVLTIIVVESTALFTTGHYFVDRFCQTIDSRIEDRAELPGRLMSQGLLSYDLVGDTTAMRRLVNENIVEAMVIRRDMLVFSAADDQQTGRSAHHVLPANLVRVMQPEMAVLHHRSTEHGDSYLTVISPLRSNDNLAGYLYLRVDTSYTEAQKRSVVRLFVICSLLCILLSTAAVVLVLHFLSSKRLRQTIECLRAAESGDLDIRIAIPRSNDEIAALDHSVNSLIQDIQLRTAESDGVRRALTLNESRYRGITENSAELTMVLCRDDTFTYCNPALTHILGYATEEILGGSALRLVHADDVEAFTACIHTLRHRPGQTRVLPDMRFLPRTGDAIHVECTITNLYDTPGVEGIVLYGHVITTRVIAERDHLASEENLSITFDSIRDAVLATDEHGKALTVENMAAEPRA